MPDDALESLYRDRRIHRIGGCKSRLMQSNGEPSLDAPQSVGYTHQGSRSDFLIIRCGLWRWGMNTSRVLRTAFLGLLAGLQAVYGQSVSGQISGTVADAGGSVIPAASVVLTNDLTRQTRTFTTESAGAFVFTNLVEIGRASCRERV